MIKTGLGFLLLLLLCFFIFYEYIFEEVQSTLSHLINQQYFKELSHSCIRIQWQFTYFKSQRHTHEVWWKHCMSKKTNITYNIYNATEWKIQLAYGPGITWRWVNNFSWESSVRLTAEGVNCSPCLSATSDDALKWKICCAIIWQTRQRAWLTLIAGPLSSK